MRADSPLCLQVGRCACRLSAAQLGRLRDEYRKFDDSPMTNRIGPQTPGQAHPSNKPTQTPRGTQDLERGGAPAAPLRFDDAAMNTRIGPQTPGQAHPTPKAIALPTTLADVALIDAPTCAATGGMSVSWWHDEVKEGRAPQPAIRKPRCTRWRVADVRAFWIETAEQSASDARAAAQVMGQAKKASAKAQARRAAQAASTAQ